MSAEKLGSLVQVDFDPFADATNSAVRFPLTEAQREVWASSQMSAEASCAYNVCHAFRVRGAFSIDAMKAALQQLMDRHQALRLVCDADGETQHSLESAAIPLITTDLSELSADERERAIAGYTDRETNIPFDLERGPLCRGVILREHRNLHLILFTAHHIVCDGWSGGILVQELGELYEAESVGMRASLSPATPFQAYVEAQQELSNRRRASEAEQYWKNEFALPLAPLEFPIDAPRDAVKSYAAERQRRQVPNDLYRDLSRIASQNSCTPYTILFAAMQVLIYRLTGQENFVLGAVVASQAASENGPALVGHGTHILPVRATVDANVTFEEHLRATRTRLLGAFEHQSLTFGSLIRMLNLPRDSSRNPLVTVTFNFDQVTSPFRFRSVEAELLPPPKRFATFDLEFNIVKSASSIFAECIHCATIVQPATATRWLEHLETLLESICKNPAQNVASLPLLTPEQERELLAPPKESRQVVECVHQRFEHQVWRTPEAIAVSCEGASLTYAELNRRANAVAKRLMGLGAGPEVLIGLCVERNIGMVVGILGILKAGAAYLPIDLSYPAERVAFMLQDAGVAVVVSQRSLETSLPKQQAEVLFLDDVTEDGEEAFGSKSEPENLAYVIYTSGSTGKPKGCQVTHANVVRLFDQTDHWYGFGESDVWTLFHSCAFDFSVWEIWGALLYGGRLVVVPYSVSRSPEAFAQLIRSEQVTVLNQTPSAFRQLIPFAVGRISPAEQTLRYVIFGGEALDLASLLPWMQQFGDSQPALINMYGITETTVHVTYRRIRLKEVRERSGSLIGEPIPDLAVYLLSAHGNPVPVGVAGEMYVAGAGVARGYLRRPELTAERFIESPLAGGGCLYRTGDLARRLPNGGLEYLGRIDHQVKIRGFRIELGEIEYALQSLPEVLETAVVIDGEGDDKRIIAYLVLAPGVTLSPSELRSLLLQSLPEYMIPAAFVLIEAMPITPNGKLDRKALPAPDMSAARMTHDIVRPETQTQTRLAALWEAVLNVKNVGIHESFFDLGGHSILAARLMAQVRSSFGVQLAFHNIFRAPTVSSLAALIEAKLPRRSEPQIPGVAASSGCE
jgi:amino acid adenylation domain-containing protein